MMSYTTQGQSNNASTANPNPHKPRTLIPTSPNLSSNRNLSPPTAPLLPKSNSATKRQLITRQQLFNSETSNPKHLYPKEKALKPCIKKNVLLQSDSSPDPHSPPQDIRSVPTPTGALP